MSLAYEPSAPRRRIASKARAWALVEAAAERHRLEVQRVLCARWDRDCTLARGEIITGLRDELGWSWRAIGEMLGLTHEGARQVFSCHKKRLSRAAILTPMVQADRRVVELEGELARLTGADLVSDLSDAVELGGAHGGRLGGVIVLAILVEAYPRSVLGPAILDLYAAACERLDFGARDGASYALITKNASNLALHFRERRWPAPVEAGRAVASRRLTDEAALFLNERVGSPKRSLIEAQLDTRAR